jgi:hypothetical protein
MLGVSISARHVETLTERIGDEWKAKRDQEASAYQRNELPRMYGEAPECAAAMLDGGRLQTRANEKPPGVHEPGWREPKYGCFLTYRSTVSDVDPQPDPPEKFLQKDKVAKLVGEMQDLHGRPAAPEQCPAPVSEARQPKEEEQDAPSEVERPQKLIRTCVATLENSEVFGWLVAAEVYRRSLDLAARKACVCDGQKYNWSVWEEYLKPLGFVAILDFVHMLCYLYTAAQACRPKDEPGAWALYEQWLRWAWSGEVQSLLTDLQDKQVRLGLPPKGASKNDPRQVLATALGYVANNRERVDYPRYRRLGLPISSAPVESMIKQMNKRVKGTEKFWCADNGEAVLQVICAERSDDNRVVRLWNEPRPYQRAVGANRLRPTG